MGPEAVPQSLLPSVLSLENDPVLEALLLSLSGQISDVERDGIEGGSELRYDKLAAAHQLLRELHTFSDYTDRQIAPVRLFCRKLLLELVKPERFRHSHRGNPQIDLVCDLLRDELNIDIAGDGWSDPDDGQAWSLPDTGGSAHPALETHETLKRMRQSVGQSRRRIQDAICQARALVDRLSRPGVRPLTLLSLPDELLREIFSYATGSHGVYTIMRYRRLCRRLSIAATPFLMSEVRVKPNRASLARLEAIAQHPVFRTSVRSVCFELSMYQQSCYHHIGRFHQQWTVLAHEHPYYVKTRSLKARHREYRRLFEKQRRLCSEEGFFDRVAAAMAKMPNERAIQFHEPRRDCHPIKIDSPFWGIIPERPYKILARICSFGRPTPFSYDVASEDMAYFPTFLKLVLEALEKKDYLPKSISMDFCGRNLDIIGWSTYSALPKAAQLQQYPDIRPALKGLERFSLVTNSDSPLLQSGLLRAFLAPFLAAPCLERLEIHRVDNYRGRLSPIGPQVDMGRALTYGPRPHLTEINLRHITLTQRMLVSLFRQSAKPFRRIVLQMIYLAAGTWTDVMDGLKQVECTSKFIEHPRGAEFAYVSHERQLVLFRCEPDTFASLVGAYINGAGTTNPMRAFGLSDAVYREIEMKTQRYYASEVSDDQDFWARFELAPG